MTLLVAEITKDILYEQWNNEGGEHNNVNHAGKRFEYEAMPAWWGWDDLPGKEYFEQSTKTTFKLYDDDGELYYEGWLLNDDECLVQQFVRDWAAYDSGCTSIEVKDKETGKWVQEIG